MVQKCLKLKNCLENIREIFIGRFVSTVYEIDYSDSEYMFLSNMSNVKELLQLKVICKPIKLWHY